VRAAVDRCVDDARGRLPSLDRTVAFVLDPNPPAWLVPPGYGVGGLAETPEQVKIYLDATVELEPEERLRRLHGAVLHEAMHVAQGFTMWAYRDRRPPPALEHAVYEGCATVLERDRAGTDPPWARLEDDETMCAWAAEVAALGTAFDWRRWKFHDPQTGRSFVLYRVGTFVVDRALAATGEEIEAFAGRSAAEIAAAAGFA
jgi:hypothetical protein